MKIVIFLTSLAYGGTEKAACRWARGLKERGHSVSALVLADGPRRADLDQHGIPAHVLEASAKGIAAGLRERQPDVIHTHAPGYPQTGDLLGEALGLMRQKIPVVQTNVFGRLQNPKEDAWTDFRLFISWTSCVQAARRASRKLDQDFFRRASVAVYPVDPIEPALSADVAGFREQLGVANDEVLFGRLSRPEPNKWTNLALDAFQRALRKNPKLKLLLRQPPPTVSAALRTSPDARHFVTLPATTDADELRLTLSAVDAVLHTSSIGESFGYGIAEPMNLGKPVITHSVPWADQAQIELVRDGECGFVTSTPATMAEAISKLADDATLRQKFGAAARQHIRSLADPENSINRLEAALRAAVEKRDNPFAAEDLERARATAAYLNAHQFGHSRLERVALRLFYYRVCFHQFRTSRKLRKR